jgi:hypothetical protein
MIKKNYVNLFILYKTIFLYIFLKLDLSHIKKNVDELIFIHNFTRNSVFLIILFNNISIHSSILSISSSKNLESYLF